MRYRELTIEGRNAVLEAFRSGKTVDKLFIQDGLKDGPILSITREARKQGAVLNYVEKERLDRMSQTVRHCTEQVYLQAGFGLCESIVFLCQLVADGACRRAVVLLDGGEETVDVVFVRAYAERRPAFRLEV